MTALQDYQNKTNPTFLLQGYTLAKGAKIKVSLTVTDPTNGKTASAFIDLIMDTNGDNIYCGPCQLTNRASCSTLKGICWNNYLNNTEKPNFTDTCLWNMAKICYDIWKNNINDPQCGEYKNILNYTLMSTVPAPLVANHTSWDGSIITIIFNTNISYSQLTACAMVLSSASLKTIGPDSSCNWVNASTYQIKYAPSGGNFTKNLTLKSGVIAIDYIYAQAFMPETTLSVIQPILNFKTTLSVPASASPCATLTISIIPEPSQSNLWQFTWIISYLSGTYTSKENDDAKKYFEQFAKWSSTNRMLSIPSSYLYPSSILGITVNTKNNLSASVFVNEAKVNLSADIPSVTIKSKTSLLDILRGNKKNSLPVEVAKKNCGQRRRLLQGSANDSNSDLTDVIIWFEVFSGPNETSIKTRSDEEKQIEVKLNERFLSLQLVSVSVYDYFRYDYYLYLL